MTYELNCNNIGELIEKTCGDKGRTDCIDLITALYAIHSYGPIGRHGLSRELDISERRARTLLEWLKNQKLIDVHKAAGAEVKKDELTTNLLDGMLCLYKSDYTLALINNASKDVMDLIVNHILTARDEIVLSIGDPSILEMIGYVHGEDLIAPGMPNHMMNTYRELVRGIKGKALIAIYRGRCPRCCAALMYTIYAICKKYNRINDNAKRANHSWGFSTITL